MATPALPSNVDRTGTPAQRLEESSSSLSSRRVGFVGLGNMGYLMARNLAQTTAKSTAGPILVWNRSESKADKLVQEVGRDNARKAQELTHVVDECDIIITNLANDDVVKAVYEKFVATLASRTSTPYKIFVETSTVYPTLSGELNKLFSQFPQTHLVTCPVLGAPAAADKAQLVLIMSGDNTRKKLVSELLVPGIGRKVMDLGEDLSKAPTFKLIANSLIMGNLELLAGAFALTAKTGIDGQNVLGIMQEFFPVPGLIAYAHKMLNEQFDGDAGFDIDGGIKDARHIRQLSEEYNCPLPAIDVAFQHLLTTRALHEQRKEEGRAVFQRLDWSGLVAAARTGAGLPGFERSKDTSMAPENSN